MRCAWMHCAWIHGCSFSSCGRLSFDGQMGTGLQVLFHPRFYRDTSQISQQFSPVRLPLSGDRFCWICW